jgi:hypothetical protein
MALSSDDEYSRAKARSIRGFGPRNLKEIFGGGRPPPRNFAVDPRRFRGGPRRRPNPFMHRGIGGFRGLGGRGPRRRSAFSNMFGGIGGMGRRRGFNPFMNRFGGGGFNPFARFGGVDPRVSQPGETIPGTSIPFPQHPWHSCPHPEEEILLADDSWIKAKDIQVGDKVKTLTAKDFKEGEYEITRAEIIDNQPRCEVFFKDSKSIISSYSHPYAVEDKGFVEAQDIKAGDTVGDLIVTEVKPLDWGSVVSLSVDEAETYMLKGGSEDKPVAVLSHNKSIAQSPTPRPGDPGYEEWRVRKDAELGQKWAQNPPMPGTGFWTAYEKWLERGNNPIPAAQAMLEKYPLPQPHRPPSLADEGSPEGPAMVPPMETTAPVMPAAPQPVAPVIPPIPPTVMAETPFGPQPVGATASDETVKSMPTVKPPTIMEQTEGVKHPIDTQPLLPSVPVAPTPPVDVVQESIEREIIPPELPVAPIQQQATPNTLMVQDREPGFTQADFMRPQMTGTPATAFPSLLPHQQFAPTNMMGEPQKKALRDILKGSFGFGGF